MRRCFLVLLALSLCVGACGNKKEAPPRPSASASAVASTAPKPPPPPPTPRTEVSFETKDGIPLKGEYYDAGDSAPIVVFAHRFRGDHTEWKPMAERLAKSEQRYSMVNFDLRGHGQSASSTGKEQLSWATMKEDDIPFLVTDVRAAIGFGLKQSEGKAPGVVLVGSSLGAALVAAAAGQEAKVTALALVSPGASIEGFDLYHPFADVRTLPSFVACAADDNVCKAPIDALGKMGKEHATTKTYEGGGHGVLALLGKSSLGDDLEQWLVSVYDEKPKERRLREPPPPDAKKKRPKGKGKGK